MIYIPEHVLYNILGFLDVESYINYSFTCKENIDHSNNYLKSMKNLYKVNKVEKTIHNCLYKMMPNKYKNNDFSKIVKIIKCVDLINEKKITYLVMSKLGVINYRNGEKLYCVYPDWVCVKNIDQDKLIPFY